MAANWSVQGASVMDDIIEDDDGIFDDYYDKTDEQIINEYIDHILETGIIII